MLAASGAALGACSNSQNHQLSATKLGDLSFPVVDEGNAGDDPAATCGDGAVTEAGGARLDRMPYLQRTSENSVSVLFTTRKAGDAAEVLELTTPSGELIERIQASDDPGAKDGRQQLVTLNDLQPDTYYCYSLVGATNPTGLRTAPATGAELPVRFIAFGDSGDDSAGQLAVHDQMGTVPFDLILHTGDIAYDSGSMSALENTFFDVYADYLRNAPVFPTTGNHDYETASAEPFRQVFDLPENGGSKGNERWYSFDYGDAHFVALDTEQRLADQATWLERDLSNNQLPWKIVYFHRPPFSSGDHGSNLEVRQAFVPLFEKFGVQLVLSGHDHDYERTLPMNGVTYVVTGGGGKGTRSVGQSSFTAFSDATLHFVYGTLEPDALVLHAIDAMGQQFDSVRIAP